MTTATPDLADLRLLVAVDGTGSFGAAARAAGVTQQAVSQRIRALEHNLGIALVVRTPRGSRLTDAGALVAEWSTDLLDAADRLDTALESLRTRQAAPLRVAASLTIAEYLVPGWLVRFRADEGEKTAARVELIAANSTAVLDLVRRGTVDLGFVETPDLPDNLHMRTVAHDELVVVVPPAHPWAMRASITGVELAATPLIVREAGSGTRRALQLALDEHGLTPAEPAGELPTTGAVRAAVLASGAPAVLSALAVAEALRSGVLVRARVSDLRVRRRLVAVWGHEDPGPHAARFVGCALADDAARHARHTTARG